MFMVPFVCSRWVGLPRVVYTNAPATIVLFDVAVFVYYHILQLPFMRGNSAIVFLPQICFTTWTFVYFRAATATM